MRKLDDDLEILYQFRDLRDRAIEMRDRARASLNGISSIDEAGRVVGPDDDDRYKNWIGMGNRVEAALLLKARNRRSLEAGEPVSIPDERDAKLLRKLENLTLKDLFPPRESDSNTTEPQSNIALDRRIPVLLAALALQILARRSSTAFSQAALFCYYRVLLELTVAARPDWTIGAARAGEGGNISVYVTGECIRAILSLERAFKNTTHFLERAAELNDRYQILVRMKKSAGATDEQHPLSACVAKVCERLALDFYVSVEPYCRELALDIQPEPLWTAGADQIFRSSFQWIDAYLRAMPERLRLAAATSRETIDSARKAIDAFESGQTESEGTAILMPPRQRPRNRRSSREFAKDVIDLAFREAETSEMLCTGADSENVADLLRRLIAQFTQVQTNIRRLLDPSRRYVEAVLDRELAGAPNEFDAGELVFAASSFGALKGWVSSRSHLMRACQVLIETMPPNGMLSTNRPFHSTRRGYKLFPTGCDMFASLAQVLERAEYEFAAAPMRTFLDTIQDKLIDEGETVGWNFEGATESEKPSTWVTAVAVTTLDRVVDTLNARINAIVLKHFDRPSMKATAKLTLNGLIYPDHGFSVYYDGRYGIGRTVSIGVRLQQMRAHLKGVPLPPVTEDEREDVFAAVLYGPPQTGKTTLAETLALSSNVPLIRLSPFDLTLESHQSIEGRTRLVFEALSMLSGVVILFDEFESVLKRRDTDPTAVDQTPNTLRPPEVAPSPATEFLLTGLLPQLVKLHTVARRQQIVYCLATNHLKQIDSAAIRRGRFDLWIPVYNPDPLSRTASFLFRLHRFVERGLSAKDWVLDFESAKRLLEIVVTNADVPASTLADVVLRLPSWLVGNEPMPKDGRPGRFFRYVFQGTDDHFDRRRKAFAMTEEDRDLLKRRPDSSTPAWADEPRERAWLKSVENEFADHFDDLTDQLSVGELFRRCLVPRSTMQHTRENAS